MIGIGESTEEKKDLYTFEIYEKGRVVGGSQFGFDLLDALLLKIDFEDLGYTVKIVRTT
ncbi:MAG: hypothetical protein ACM3ON_11630 [Chloroflexota bacterium]